MENFWTSKKPVIGLRHFVLVNRTKEKGQIFFLMVSVVDSEINLKITYKELLNNGDWEKGWLNLTKTESITATMLEMIPTPSTESTCNASSECD